MSMETDEQIAAPGDKNDKDARYLEHLKSDGWRDQRELAFQRWGRFCNCCGTREPLTIHHLFYRNLVDCISDDLMPLCVTCHDVFHAVNQSPYSMSSERCHFEKRRLTIRRVLKFRFDAFEKVIPAETVERKTIWEAKQALRHRPDWRFVDYSKVSNAVMIEAAKDPNFKVDQEWLIRGSRPVYKNRPTT